MINQISGILFPYLNKEVGRRFGSKWLKLHGYAFVGSPEELGLLSDGDPAVAKSFYCLRTDRKIPKGDEAIRRWRSSQLMATQVREAGRPLVSRNVAVVTFFICVAVMAITIPFSLMS